MIAFIPPTVDGALWLAAICTALTLGVGHLAMIPGLFVKSEPPRPVAYVMGLGIVLGYFTALYLLARDPVLTPLQPILDAWFLAIAGAIPTIGFRILRDHLHLRDEVKNGNN